MTTAVKELLDSFDALSGAEKHEAAAHLLQRALQLPTGDIPEMALVSAAEELFRELDAREAQDAQP